VNSILEQGLMAITVPHSERKQKQNGNKQGKKKNSGINQLFA